MEWIGDTIDWLRRHVYSSDIGFFLQFLGVVVFILLVGAVVILAINPLVVEQHHQECNSLISLNGADTVKWQDNTCFIKYEGKWLPTSYFEQKTQYIPMPIVIPSGGNLSK